MFQSLPTPHLILFPRLLKQPVEQLPQGIILHLASSQYLPLQRSPSQLEILQLTNGFSGGQTKRN